MSRSIDLFVDCPGEVPDLVVMIAEATGAGAVEVAPERWTFDLPGELVAELGRHPYIDDGDLHLSRYPWVLSVSAGHDGSLMEHPATAALRLTAEALRLQGARVLLALDLQNRVNLAPLATGDDSATPSGPPDPKVQVEVEVEGSNLPGSGDRR